MAVATRVKQGTLEELHRLPDDGNKYELVRLRGRRDLVERLKELSPDDVGVATMTVAELLYGALVSARPARRLRRVMSV